MPHPNYGFSLVGTLPTLPRGLFPSGVMYEQGKLALIIPPGGVIRDPNDWIPVWETQEKAEDAMARLSRNPETFWRAINVRASIMAGGPGRDVSRFRGVEGWVIPPRELPDNPMTEAYRKDLGEQKE